MEPGTERKRIRPRVKRVGTFHHGDLREALIGAAMQAVEKTGHLEVSLRPIAERLGVTQPAVYRHFKDKGALLAEVAARAGALLDRTMAAAMGAERDPYLAVRAAGAAYVRWAATNPHLFRLFSSRISAEQRSGPVPAFPREHYYQGMGGVVPIDDPLLEDAFRVSWALVHGLATLVVEHVFQLVDTDAGRLAAADGVLDCYLEMLRAKWPR